ncbi:MAG: hypothetical protein CMJ19_00805 [Phycisphaeraceae bacterium]|nr:hypothetical protein [Phycisphaeraceae bacterium]|tara:strand:- start:105 stop:407 length:303 start_codon:yes stop_codon:yes gene_type:complete
MRDLMIFSSIVLFIGFGFLAIFKFSNHLICVAGYVLATLTTCLGIVYFGWMPFFGGTYSHATYFGCIVLIMGLWGYILTGAMNLLLKSETSAPINHQSKL